MLKVNNKDTANGVVLVPLLTLNIFHTLLSSVSIFNFEHVITDWDFSKILGLGGRC